MNLFEMKQLVIGLTATRGCGKDTLFEHLREIDDRFCRYAFADPLKADLAPLIQKQFGFDVFKCSAEQKEMVRPLLIGYGMAMRNLDPLYWVKRTVTNIDRDLKTGLVIPVTTDVRFLNEAVFLRDHFPNFLLINITRDGAPPPTEEEEKHFRGVAEQANINFHWGNDTREHRAVKASKLYNQIKI